MTSLVITPTEDLVLYINEGLPGSVSEDGIQTLINKTIDYADNTLTGVQPELVSGTNIKTINGTSVLGTGNIVTLSANLANEALTNVKTLSFNSIPTLTTTAGAVTIDWTAAQNYRQNEPTGGITYTFTAPPGPCHLQLQINSDGTSSPQTFIWPVSVKWLLFVWEGLANKAAIINFWYDGINYWAMGSNAV
jgi:hypothetical protein